MISGGGAVIVHQPDLPGAGKILFEPFKIAVIGPPEAVNGLVGVADDEDALALFAPGQNEAVLGGVDILELVHQKMGEGFSIYLLRPLQHLQDEVVVVHHLQELQAGPV